MTYVMSDNNDILWIVDDSLDPFHSISSGIRKQQPSVIRRLLL